MLKKKELYITSLSIVKELKKKIINIDREVFDKSEDIKEIVCFNILQIGELAKGFDKSFLSKYNKMPWKDIKGMRDWVAHGYGTIDWSDVWPQQKILLH